MAPTPKQVVDVLMKKIGEEEKNISDGTKKTCYILSCPRKDLCSVGGSLSLTKGPGYANPFTHLRTCVADGSKEKLIEIYKTAVA